MYSGGKVGKVMYSGGKVGKVMYSGGKVGKVMYSGGKVGKVSLLAARHFVKWVGVKIILPFQSSF